MINPTRKAHVKFLQHVPRGTIHQFLSADGIVEMRESRLKVPQWNRSLHDSASCRSNTSHGTPTS
jgi:hypothetical protein